MTKTTAPPAPPPPPSAHTGAVPSPSAKQAPTARKAPEKPKQPLELRFPRLYNDFESVTPVHGGKVEELMVPKKDPPTLHDVINVVCASHGTSDRGLIGDLNSSIAEFLGVETVKLRAKNTVPMAPAGGAVKAPPPPAPPAAGKK